MLTQQDKKENQIFLERARQAARALLFTHPEGLGIDDIREHCERVGIVPTTPYLWGAVVKDRRFTRNGDRRSKRKVCHGRWINVWKLK